MDSPDNLTVTAARRARLAAEDDACRRQRPESVNRLIGISPRGEAFTFAVNVYSESELAGVVLQRPTAGRCSSTCSAASEGTPDAALAHAGMTCS